nr:hypothetical protein BaRGS_026788 [Batillaria attramentaria]
MFEVIIIIHVLYTEQHVDDFGDEAAPDYDDLYEAMDGDDMKNKDPSLSENTRSGNIYTNIDSPGFDVKISLPSSPPPPPPPHHHPNNHNYDDLVENSVRPLYDTIDGNS